KGDSASKNSAAKNARLSIRDPVGLGYSGVNPRLRTIGTRCPVPQHLLRSSFQGRDSRGRSSKTARDQFDAPAVVVVMHGAGSSRSSLPSLRERGFYN